MRGRRWLASNAVTKLRLPWKTRDIPWASHKGKLLLYHSITLQFRAGTDTVAVMVNGRIPGTSPAERVAARWPLHLGATPEGAEFTLPIESLTRHAVIFGSSGSGKTVFAKVIAEECIAKRLPLIVIDTQGDLTGLALGVNSEQSRSAAKFNELVDVKIWTPGSSIGIPISMTPSMVIPRAGRPEDRSRAVGAIGCALAAMINDTSEVTLAGLAMIVDWADRQRVKLGSISDLVSLLRAPPIGLLGAIAPLFDKRDLLKLAKAFVVKTMGPAGHLGSLGLPIDVNELLGLYAEGGPASRGKARLSIISTAALSSDQERQRFVASLCSAIYQWMLDLDGSQMWGALFIDEVAPFLPPVMKPPAKQPLSLLLRQSRKYGVSVIVASQSPGDLDFTALGQVGTIAVGRLSTRQEIQKIAPALSANGASAELLASLSAKQPGEFVVMSHALDRPAELRVRPTITPHRLVTLDEIEELVTDDDRRSLGGAPAVTSEVA